MDLAPPGVLEIAIARTRCDSERVMFKWALLAVAVTSAEEAKTPDMTAVVFMSTN